MPRIIKRFTGLAAPVIMMAVLAPGCRAPDHEAGTSDHGTWDTDLYASWLEDPEASPLIDFSYAGYRHGEEVPDWRKAPRRFFDVTDYGAVPNDGKDDIDAIQSAIDKAAVSGGIVRFPAGTFDFDVKSARRYLHVYASNIILLGAGDGIDGTILHDHTPSETPDPSRPWLAGLYPGFIHVGKLPRDTAWSLFDHPELIRCHVEPAPRNSLHLSVGDPSRLEAGKIYLLTQQDPDGSLVRALTFPLEKTAGRWQATEGEESYKFRQMVSIASIDGNLVTLAEPIHFELREPWSPRLWELPHLVHEVGIAGFLMRSDWEGPMIHHLNGVHDNGWDHIKINDAAECWVYSNIFENTSSAVTISNGYHCTVFDCRILGVPGHNGFIVGGYSTGNLLYHLVGGEQMHTWSIQGYAGGNVFYQVWSGESSAIDCHAGLTLSNLFDNVYGGAWKHGGNPRYLPPAHGGRLVLWNWAVGMTEPYKGRIKMTAGDLKQTPGLAAAGVHGLYGQQVCIVDQEGTLLTGDSRTPWGTIQSLNGDPSPASLFLEQRKRRLGDPYKGILIR